MNDAHQCPGCDGTKAVGDLCCENCWTRIPSKLPIGAGWVIGSWKRRRIHARMVRDYREVENINAAVTNWLSAHKVRTR